VEAQAKNAEDAEKCNYEAKRAEPHSWGGEVAVIKQGDLTEGRPPARNGRNWRQF
jgi:hypothetical protein